MKRFEAQRDIDELNEFYAGLAQQSKSNHRTKTSNLIRRLRKASRKNKASRRSLSGTNRKELIGESILSIANPNNTPAISYANPVIAAKSKKRSVKNWVRNLDPIWIPWMKLLTVLVALFLLLFITWAGVAIYKSVTRDESILTDLTPPIVYVPNDLPEGFSVGSGTQKLENGAQFYTLYDDKGHAITISQQLRPADFDTSIFGESTGFDTPLGKAHIVRTDSRTTGYIMTEDTMILFNTVPDIDRRTMHELMMAFEL